MDKDKLRKADIFSGTTICLFGLWIVSQAVQMPMKDSWGGVQNVWFVSPALFPLLVGGMIALLGGILIRVALKEVGFETLKNTLGWLFSRNLVVFLRSEAMMRFYTIVILLFSFVFLNIPRVDFFLCSVFFLVVFISIFYIDDSVLLIKMLRFYIAEIAILFLWFAVRIPSGLDSAIPFSSDWLTIGLILSYSVYAWRLIRSDGVLRRKYRIGQIVAVTTPFILCPIFKYFLLVPMPFEGLIVAVLDAVWYWDF